MATTPHPIYCYTPCYPEWTVRIGWTSPTQTTIQEMLLVISGVNPDNVGTRPGSNELLVSAVRWEQSEPVKRLTLKKFQTEKESPENYCRLTDVVRDWKKKVDRVVSRFNRPISDQYTPIKILEWASNEGFDIPSWFHRYLTRVPPAPDASEFYLPTNDMAELVHTLCSLPTTIVDFGPLRQKSLAQWKRVLGSTEGRQWLDVTMQHVFKNDPRVVAVIQDGSAGGGSNQTKRHIFWTLLAIAIWAGKAKASSADKALTMKALSTVTAKQGAINTESRKPNKARLRVISSRLFQDDWPTWLRDRLDDYGLK